MQRCAVILTSLFIHLADTQQYAGTDKDDTVNVKMPAMGFSDRYGRPYLRHRSTTQKAHMQLLGPSPFL